MNPTKWALTSPHLTCNKTSPQTVNGEAQGDLPQQAPQEAGPTQAFQVRHMKNVFCSNSEVKRMPALSSEVVWILPMLVQIKHFQRHFVIQNTADNRAVLNCTGRGKGLPVSSAGPRTLRVPANDLLQQVREAGVQRFVGRSSV